MLRIRSFNSTEILIGKTLELLRDTLSKPGNLMLSGGSTPCAIYNRLAENSCFVHEDRKLFLSDERMAPFDSDKNNARNLEPMLTALHCADRFLRVDTSLPAKKAAEKFERDLKPMDKIDLGFLGVGADGHTAGFFTLEQAGIKTGPLTLHTDRPDGMQGVSVTPALFQHIEKLILLVTGESKRGIIHTLLTSPETIPAGITLANHPNVELWSDIRVS